MEIPLAATFLGLFGWNIYQLVKKYNARRRQSCLVKLIEDQSNSLIMTLYPYKKRKLNENQEVIIKSPQKVDLQENQEQNETNQYERIQTVLEQVEYERFQEQDYIDNVQTFDSIVCGKNKDDLQKNKQNQDFSFTSQNANQINEDQKYNYHDVNNHVKELISSDLVDKETSNFTFTNTKDQYQDKQAEDDLNYNQKYEINSYEDEIKRLNQYSEFNQMDKNSEQQIIIQGNNTLGQFQDKYHNYDAYSNFYNQNHQETLLPFFPSNNQVITSQQSSHFVQDSYQNKYEIPNFQIDVLNQTQQQQQYQNKFNCQNFTNSFTSNSQPIYSVNNIQQSNQIYNPFYQEISNNQINMNLLHNQNSFQVQPSFGQQNQDIRNQNITFQNIGAKEHTEIPRLCKEEFSFKKQQYSKFDQNNLEQNQFQNDSIKPSIRQIPESKSNKGQSIFTTSLTANQSNIQKEIKSNHLNDFSFYLQLLGGGGGLNSKVSVPSGNLLSLLLNN
ncbi:unnamed protein product [Paramecium pentaurelia]|uniref:Uncharacterized protein n=1 Tax=Paramecium pentaurelia TaxID=43138 RepID=A0A8S1TUF4_9CILI|nr:unnamed protein product [Paramecium pentaurelia]